MQETKKSLLTSEHDHLEFTNPKELSNESMQSPKYRKKSPDEQLRIRNDLAWSHIFFYLVFGIIIDEKAMSLMLNFEFS